MVPSPEASTALRLTGHDVLPLLHRITTNVLEDLAVGETRMTLFCDHRGRLLHRARVLHAPDGVVWLLRDDAPGGSLATWLERHVFRDDVTIDDRIDWPHPGTTFDGYTWPLPPSAVERIEAGQPRQEHEVRDAFHPYEVNLWHEVHLDKGCYTGQEALQRLVTYESVRRQLVRLAGDGPPPAVPQPVFAGGPTAHLGARPVGELTSAAARGADWVGLAVISREATGPLTVGEGDPLRDLHVFESTRPLGLR